MAHPAQNPQNEAIETVRNHAQIAQNSTSSIHVDSPLVIDELLLRMRAGDRAAAAEFLERYGAKIRRRIRGKLGPGIRRLFDSMEILSTLGRRLDLYILSGRLQVASEAQLWTLLFKMADHALVDKARVFRRLQTVETEDSEFAVQLAKRLRKVDAEAEAGVELELESCLRLVNDPTDRKILSLWLAGEPPGAIGPMVDLAPTAVRKRWERIKAELRERLVLAS